MAIALCFLGLSLFRAWDRWRAADGGGLASPASAAARDPFESALACRGALLDGPPRPAQASSGLRVLSWNLRWFPYGVPPESVTSETDDVDVEWLACIMATQGVSIVALQEIVADGRGQGALKRLAAALGRASGAPPFAVHLDPCPARNQHVAYLVDTRQHPSVRVTAVAELNPAGGMCAHRLRPGLELSGPSLPVSFLNVHLDSGQSPRDAGNRRTSLARAVAHYGRQAKVILLGDLNLMGCAECKPPLSALAEARSIVQTLPLRPLDGASGPDCSHYYRGHGAALDRALALGPVPKTAQARVIGACQRLGCSGRPSRTGTSALPALSDHCPLLLELSDRE